MHKLIISRYRKKKPKKKYVINTHLWRFAQCVMRVLFSTLFELVRWRFAASLWSIGSQRRVLTVMIKFKNKKNVLKNHIIFGCAVCVYVCGLSLIRSSTVWILSDTLTLTDKWLFIPYEILPRIFFSSFAMIAVDCFKRKDFFFNSKEVTIVKIFPMPRHCCNISFNTQFNQMTSNTLFSLK